MDDLTGQICTFPSETLSAQKPQPTVPSIMAHYEVVIKWVGPYHYYYSCMLLVGIHAFGLKPLTLILKAKVGPKKENIAHYFQQT